MREGGRDREGGNADYPQTSLSAQLLNQRLPM